MAAYFRKLYVTPFSQTLGPETKQHFIPRTGLQVLRHCIQNVVEMVADHPLLSIYPPSPPSMIIELSWAHGCLLGNQILSLPCCWVWLRSDQWNAVEGMRATSALLIEEKVSRFSPCPFPLATLVVLAETSGDTLNISLGPWMTVWRKASCWLGIPHLD